MSIISSEAEHVYKDNNPLPEGKRMNEIQLTNHLTAQFMASTISRYEAEIREDGDFRGRRLPRPPVRHEPQTSQAQMREIRET